MILIPLHMPRTLANTIRGAKIILAFHQTMGKFNPQGWRQFAMSKHSQGRMQPWTRFDHLAMLATGKTMKELRDAARTAKKH